MIKFKESLDIGDKGVQLFVTYKNAEFGYERFVPTDGLNGDVLDTELGRVIEIKYEPRATATGNLFIEKYSSESVKTPGGPWKASLDNCLHYISVVEGAVVNGETYEVAFFYFTPEDLVKEIEQGNFQERRAKGDNYGTTGVLYPYRSVAWEQF